MYDMIYVDRYSLPFDRHDWIIDRNGKDIRYVIGTSLTPIFTTPLLSSLTFLYVCVYMCRLLFRSPGELQPRCDRYASRR